MNPSECPICTNQFTDSIGDYIPKILPCGHTFCSMCLFSLYHNCEITCPQCRLHHQIIDYHLIPKNYTVIEFILYYKKISSNLIENPSNSLSFSSPSNNEIDSQLLENNHNNSNNINSSNNNNFITPFAPLPCEDGQIAPPMHHQNISENIIQRKPLEDLTIEEVSALLINLKLSKFVDIFRENDIDGLTLSHCRRENDLIEAGINIKVKARFLFDKIQSFQSSGVSLCDIQLSSPSDLQIEDEISLWIVGMTGMYEFMNGFYYPTDEIYMGRRRYFKLQYDCWIEYNSVYNQWHIKPNDKKTTTNAWAYITSLSTNRYPFECNSSWHLYDGKSATFIKNDHVHCFPHFSIHFAGIPTDNSIPSLHSSLNGLYEPVPNSIYGGICRYRQRSFGYSSSGRYWIEYSCQHKQWQLKTEDELGSNSFLLYILCSNPKDIWSSICQWILSPTLLSSTSISISPDILSFPKLYSLEISGGNGPTASHIRGIYQPSHEIFSGWVRYQKVSDTNCWLEKMESQQQWHIKPTKDKCLTNAWACVKYNHQGPPYLIRDGWLVYDGSVFNLDQDLKCTRKLPLI